MTWSTLLTVATLTYDDLVDVVDSCLLHVVFVDGLVEVHVPQVDDGRQDPVDGVEFVVVEAQRLEAFDHFLELAYIVLRDKMTVNQYLALVIYAKQYNPMIR
jgi:hypothetical protein